MSVFFESVRWNACVHRLDLRLYSHLKEFWEMGKGGRTHVNSKGKIPCTGRIILRGGSNPRRGMQQDSQPNTLPVSYSGPNPRRGMQQDSQPNTLPMSYSGPNPRRGMQQDSQPNTLPMSYSGPSASLLNWCSAHVPHHTATYTKYILPHAPHHIYTATCTTSHILPHVPCHIYCHMYHITYTALCSTYTDIYTTYTATCTTLYILLHVPHHIYCHMYHIIYILPHVPHHIYCHMYYIICTALCSTSYHHHHHGGPSVSRTTLSVPLICGYRSGSAGRSWTCRAVRSLGTGSSHLLLGYRLPSGDVLWWTVLDGDALPLGQMTQIV